MITILLLIGLLLPTGSATVFAQGTPPPTNPDDPAALPKSLSMLQKTGNNSIEDITASYNDILTVTPPSLINGNFEQGQYVGWSEGSTHGWPIVVPVAQAGIYSHDSNGVFAAWLGGDDNDTSYISQAVNLSAPATLRLWYWIGSEDACGSDYGFVQVNSSAIYTWSLCSANNTGGWALLDLNLSAYVGQTFTLALVAITDDSLNSNLFIDDISLIVHSTITGNAGVAGATLTYTTDGTSQFSTADGSGNYSISVLPGWSGTVTPYKIGYAFTPPNRAYSDVQSDLTSQDYTAQVCPACADIDTVGVFRPSNGALYLKNLNITGYADVAINYGVGGDYPVVGDWDGNGTATIGIYRNGVFYLRNANTIGYADITFAFGSPGDQPIAGDWDNDGIDTVGVYRSSTITFYLRNSNSSGAPQMSFALGTPGDVGITGDWNGDGFDTTGVFRPSNGALYLKNTNETGFADIQINYGIGGDQPVTGDWNNDGVDTIGIYRNGTFYLRNSNTIGYADLVFALGVPGDMPIAGNWDALP